MPFSRRALSPFYFDFLKEVVQRGNRVQVFVKVIFITATPKLFDNSGSFVPDREACEPPDDQFETLCEV